MPLDASARALDRFGPIAPSLRADLEQFEALLREWQGAHNLVSRSSLDDLWSRHIADSLQLLDHAPGFEEWIDLGSGAGFPGLIVAIACKDDLSRRFTLVEASGKKAAFLRAAARQSGANCRVVAERIETYAASLSGSADIVSARALAPLVELCRLAVPYLKRDSGLMLLLKGQDFAREVEIASKSWDFDLLESPSLTNPGGRVVTIRNLRAKAPA